MNVYSNKAFIHELFFVFLRLTRSVLIGAFAAQTYGREGGFERESTSGSFDVFPSADSVESIVGALRRDADRNQPTCWRYIKVKAAESHITQ